MAIAMRNVYGNAIIVGILATAAGCIDREIHVRSDPPGALVMLNEREVGRTPFDRPFLYYGNYDVVARAEGYQTLKTTRQVTAPWWQFVPLDLLTDFLPVRDDEHVNLKLTPLGVADPVGVLARGGVMRNDLESSEHTTHRRVLRVAPATRPATSRAATEPVDNGVEP